MTFLETPDLLEELRRLGARLTPRGDGLRIIAPQGALTNELKQAIRERKPEILKQLEVEPNQHPVLRMTLFQFAQEGCPIQLAVPGLADTLWFVPSEADVRELLMEGVHRGRIWTAAELRVVTAMPEGSQDDLLTLARVKVRFDGEVLDVRGTP